MKEIKGDLIKLAIKGEFDVIVHGCNCRKNMGAGIAKQIKEEFPHAYKADRHGYSFPGYFTYYTYKDGLTIINAYTQINIGRANENYIKNFKKMDVKYKDSQKNRYEFIRLACRRINRLYNSKKIGLPLIGCGLAGGKWDIVKEIIKEELKDCDVTIVHYKK